MNRYGWHWRHASGLSYGDGRQPKVGERLQARRRDGKPVERPAKCGQGMHAHPDISATRYCGSVCSFVLVENTLKAGPGAKFVGTHRTILWECEAPARLTSEKGLLAWAAKNGFRRHTARAKASKLGLTGKGKK